MSNTVIPTENLRIRKVLFEHSEQACIEQMFIVDGRQEWRELPIVVDDRRKPKAPLMERLGLSKKAAD